MWRKFEGQLTQVCGYLWQLDRCLILHYKDISVYYPKANFFLAFGSSFSEIETFFRENTISPMFFSTVFPPLQSRGSHSSFGQWSIKINETHIARLKCRKENDEWLLFSLLYSNLLNLGSWQEKLALDHCAHFIFLVQLSSRHENPKTACIESLLF